MNRRVVPIEGTRRPLGGVPPPPQRPLPRPLPPPPCDAIGPDGRRIVIRPAAVTDAVGDLARALSIAPSDTVYIDGRPVATRQPLVTTGLRPGSTVSTMPGEAPPRESATDAAPILVGVVTGPACRHWQALPVGRHVLGRAATADVPIDDPAIELHHGLLDVDTGGRVVFTQLTGRVPARVDGAPCTVRQPLRYGQVLHLGASILAIASSDRCAAAVDVGSIVRAERDPWREVVLRAPVTHLRPSSPDLEVPAAPREHRGPPAIGLVGAGIAVAGAALMAAVLGQALFALFAAIGALASLATWAIGTITAIRHRRRAAADHARSMEQFAIRLDDLHRQSDHDHRRDHLGVTDVLTIVHRDGGRTWERRLGTEMLRTTIGRGDCRRPSPIGDDERRTLHPDLLARLERSERLVDVSVPLFLAPATGVALHGDRPLASALARSLLVQLAALYGPADWRPIVVTDRPDHWDWVRWLPHVGAGRESGLVGADALDALRDLADVADTADPRPTVVFTDVPQALAARTGPVRRFLAATGASLVVVTDGETVPSVCGRVLEVGSTGAARWRDDGDGASDIRVAGISGATASAAARALAPLLDPEHGASTSTLPSAIALGDVIGLVGDASTVADRWRSLPPDPSLAVTIGVSADGTVDLDLVRDGPHGLIAGTTGSGKSELLRTLVVSLAAQLGPDHLTFVLVDFKGGSTFDACARLPHTIGLVTDLDDGLAARALVSLDAEVRRRERLLRSVGAEDLADYRRRGAGVVLPRLVVVIDEFASLANELPEFLSALVGVAQRGRSLGVHLVLATQRPAGVVTDDIRANTNLRLALRLNDRSDALDVVGDDRPASFSRAIPGRTAMRLGPDEVVVFQAASCSGPALTVGTLRVDVDDPRHDRTVIGVAVAPSELAALVDVIGEAARCAGLAPPHRSWLPPLPDVVTPDDLDGAGGEDDVPEGGDRDRGGAVVGLVDDPANQRRLPLRWDHAAGNLLLVGALGSGTTTTALAAVAAVMRSSSPAHAHVYVIDAHGDERWAEVARVPHCGGVIGLQETERLMRLLTRLSDELDRRASGAPRAGDIVLVVDGLGATRSVLAAVDLGRGTALLDRVLHDGPACGILACVTTDGSAAAALGTPAAHRWVFRVGDPSIAASAGLRAPVLMTTSPGRLRIVESGLEAQVVFDPDAVRSAVAAATVAAGGPAALEVLPERIDPQAVTVAEASPADPHVVSLPVGIRSADLGTAALHVPRGDHVFVGGAARTGKSTALRQLTASWRLRHPSGVVISVAHRGASDLAVAVTEPADAAPVLLVVDDADRVVDPSGVLAEVAAGRRPGMTIVAAARLEAARAAYGHWIRDVTRCRCGLIMTSPGEVDGELLGASLPRRSIIAPRPGLAWMIDGYGQQLVQVADRMPS